MDDVTTPRDRLAPLGDAAAAQAFYEGTYESGWSPLKTAAASNLRWAVVATTDLLAMLDPISDGCKTRGAAAFLVNHHFRRSVSGPAISAVLFCSFALEAFVSLGFVVANELKRPRSRRAVGYDDVITSRLADFASLGPLDRVRRLLSLIGAEQLAKSSELRIAIDELVKFRNACVHDTPTLSTTSQGQLRMGHRRIDRANRSARYGDLASTARPIRLRQVLSAVKAHDDLVAHAFKSSDVKWVGAMKTLDVGSMGFHTIRKMTGTREEWKRIADCAADWERKGEAVARQTLSIQEAEDAAAELKRTLNLRLVK